MEKIEKYDKIKAELYAAVDEKYKAFNDRIANCGYATLGVRIPVIKKLVKSVPLSCRDAVLAEFFADSGGAEIFETVLFAGCLAARKGDQAATREYLKRIIPMFGSWAHVDCVVPWLDWTDVDAMLDDFAYLLGGGEYEKRFYIIYMMSRCLGDEYIDFTLDTLKNKVVFGEYYVDMAAAWLLAEAAVKQLDKVLPLLKARAFPAFVHNKAIQKACESFRIDAETKELLKSLKTARKR